MSEEKNYLSFPPGALTPDALRIPVLWESGSAVALNKPPGLAAFQDSRVGGGPKSLLTEISSRAGAGVSQFDRRGMQTLFLLNLLDRDLSGVVLYAKSQEAKRRLKNEMGSSRFSFRYHFLATAERDEDEVSCNLPVAVHREKPLALVSSRTGKKASTVFRRLQRFPTCSLWESESVYDRFHQVRLHAAESGLSILGEELYRGRGKKGAPADPAKTAYAPGYERLCLHLFSLQFPHDGGTIHLEADYPRLLRMLIKKLEG